MSHELSNCKQCGRPFDVVEARRVYGSLPADHGCCSAHCYTSYILNKPQKSNQPYGHEVKAYILGHVDFFVEFREVAGPLPHYTLYLGQVPLASYYNDHDFWVVVSLFKGVNEPMCRYEQHDLAVKRCLEIGRQICLLMGGK